MKKERKKKTTTTIQAKYRFERDTQHDDDDVFKVFHFCSFIHFQFHFI